MQDLSDDELIALAHEIHDSTTIRPDSTLRTIAKQLMGSDSLIHILTLGIIISNELAGRLSIANSIINMNNGK
jgi:hypothetical protein